MYLSQRLEYAGSKTLFMRKRDFSDEERASREDEISAEGSEDRRRETECPIRCRRAHDGKQQGR